MVVPNNGKTLEETEIIFTSLAAALTGVVFDLLRAHLHSGAFHRQNNRRLLVADDERVLKVLEPEALLHRLQLLPLQVADLQALEELLILRPDDDVISININ